jgi:hypothetical protein
MSAADSTFVFKGQRRRWRAVAEGKEESEMKMKFAAAGAG